MLTDVCQYLRNWFERKMPKIYGTFSINNGVIWLESNQAKVYGTFTTEDGVIVKALTGNETPDKIFTVSDESMLIEVDSPAPLSNVFKPGQHIRIVGSVFNDGVHTFPMDETLEDEVFTGAIWGMAIPKAVISIANDIDAWQTKYGGADSASMSPYQSESFGGYSYSKGNGSDSSGGYGVSWADVFAKRLSPWRKI